MILVCAATGTEADACRRGIADAMAPGIEVLTTGVGPARATAALAERLLACGGGSPAPRPALIVSSGFAGALTAGLAPLAWVTASSVHRLVGLPNGRGLWCTSARRDALAGGWFHTADGGTIDDDNYLTISDRKKDVIISGGENVSSIEVEDCLYQHPAVAEAAVVGTPGNSGSRCADVIASARTADLQFRGSRGEPAVLRNLPERHQTVELLQLHTLKRTFTRHAALSTFSF